MRICWLHLGQLLCQMLGREVVNIFWLGFCLCFYVLCFYVLGFVFWFSFLLEKN